MLEMFRSRAAWDEHMRQPYNTEGNIILEDLLREPSDLRLFDEKKVTPFRRGDVGALTRATAADPKLQACDDAAKGAAGHPLSHARAVRAGQRYLGFG